MNLLEVMQSINQNGFTIAIVLFILSCIKLPKYELNIWEIFIGKINKPTVEKLDILETQIENIDEKLDAHIKDNKWDEMDRIRGEILNYASLLRRGIELTDEQYNRAAENVDKYTAFCSENPTYENMKANASIKKIKDCYDLFMNGSPTTEKKAM